VTPSHGNFLLVELTDPSLSVDGFRQVMESAGILLRYFRTPDLARHVRVTVGTAEHTAALARALAALRARLDAGEAHTLAPTHA
jgi:histidinol-phosphate/aromatic aminotransferase/cobyric acid decarboxylase-like protein